MALVDSYDIHAFDKIDSTNDIVKKAIQENTGEGFVAVAKFQTGGYGRRGSKWESPEGGLYISLLLEPQRRGVQVATIGMLAALAIRDTVCEFLPEYTRTFVRIKWPNDVIYANSADDIDASSFQKLAGISSEKIDGKICLGIGLNVEKPTVELDSTDADEFTKNQIIYLEELAHLGYYDAKRIKFSVHDVMNLFLNNFSELYEKWDSNNFPDFIELLNQSSALTGASVKVKQSRGITEGIVKGIGDDGALLVAPKDSEKNPEGF